MASYRLQRRSARGKRGHPISDTLLMFGKTRERLARLTDETRLALSLIVVDGLSYEEAAGRLNISLPEYFARLATAREALGAMVAAEEHRLAAE